MPTLLVSADGCAKLVGDWSTVLCVLHSFRRSVTDPLRHADVLPLRDRRDADQCCCWSISSRHMLVKRICSDSCACCHTEIAVADNSNNHHHHHHNNNDNNNNNCIQRGSSRIFFYNLFAAPRTVSNTYAQVAKAQSCENHVQHIERISRATRCVPLGTKGQLSILGLTELNSHFF